MPDTLAEYQAQAQRALGAYYPGAYEEQYRQRAMSRYAEELPQAQAIMEGMRTGETSQALAAQRLELGQAAAQQAGAAVGGPLAARQAMFGGGQQAANVTQRAAAGRAQEIQGAREAALAAQMRQVGYGQGLENEEMRRRQLLQQAQQQYIAQQIAKDVSDEEQRRRLIGGTLSSAAGFAQGAATAFGGPGQGG